MFRIYNDTVVTKSTVLNALQTTLSESGVTVYVSNNGFDKEGGGSEMYPYKTLTFAISQLENGGVVVILPGIYLQDFLLSQTVVNGNTYLYFYPGAYFISLESIGCTTNENSDVFIYGQGQFSSFGGSAMAHSGFSNMYILGADFFTSDNFDTITGVNIVSNVNEISMTSAVATTANAVHFVDTQNGREFTLSNIGRIFSSGTCIRCSFGDTAVDNYKLTMTGVRKCICSNANAENCIETDPPDGIGAANILSLVVSDSNFSSTSFNPAVNTKSAINVNTNWNAYVTNCNIVSNSSGFYIHAGSNAYVYNSLIVSGTSLAAGGGGNLGISNSSANLAPAGGVGILFNSGLTLDAAVTYPDIK